MTKRGLATTLRRFETAPATFPRKPCQRQFDATRFVRPVRGTSVERTRLRPALDTMLLTIRFDFAPALSTIPETFPSTRLWCTFIRRAP